MDKLNVNTLKKVAVYGAVLSVSGSAFLYYKLQEKFHKSPYFIKSLEAMKQDEEVVNFLGPPISRGILNLGRSDNYVTEHRAQLHIPLRGTKNKAELRSVCTREDNEEWKVQELELNIRGKKVPVFFSKD